MQERPGGGMVGLGQMDQPIALTLLKATGEKEQGHVDDVRKERIASLVALGTSQTFRLADVARPGGMVFPLVPGDQALLEDWSVLTECVHAQPGRSPLTKEVSFHKVVSLSS